MDDPAEPIVNPYNIYHFEYPMRKQQGRPWSGWTTDPFWRDICISRGWQDNGRFFSYSMDVHLYKRKKALVVDVPPEKRKDPNRLELAELASWWYNPKTRKIDRDGQTARSSTQLGYPLKKANGPVVFVAILQELKEPTVAALKVGEGMSKDEAEQYEKDLNKTLKEDSNFKQYGVTAEGLAKMVPHPSASLEWVRKSYDSLPE